jgi:hypothetical protein
MTVHITTALLCDIIRREDSGKLIAIGIYSKSVGIPVMPAIATFNLLLKVETSESGTQRLAVRVLRNGVEYQTLEGDIHTSEPSSDWLPLQLQPIEFLVPGRLSFEQETTDGNWREFYRIDVVRT